MWKRIIKLMGELMELEEKWGDDGYVYNRLRVRLKADFNSNTLLDLSRLIPLTCTKQELKMYPKEILSEKHLIEELGLNNKGIGFVEWIKELFK